MNPTISIIVPCYNQSEYMDECLQSVLGQTYKNWECIIVNNGSPDNTEEVAMKWVEKDERFRYLKKENGGLSSARNAGINAAKGEWILPLDCDDYIDRDYIQYCLNATKDGSSLVYSKLQLFGAENIVLDIPPFNKQRLLYFNPFYCSAVFLKSQWEKVGGYDENLKKGLEDWEFYINIIYHADAKVKKLEDYIGFFYRRKESSMNTVMNSEKEFQTKAYQYIISKHSDLYAQNFNYVQSKISESERYFAELQKLKKNKLLKLYNKIRNL